MSDKIVAEGKAETDKAKVEANKLFNEMLHRANVVTQDQYDALAQRVTELEGRMHQEFPNSAKCSEPASSLGTARVVLWPDPAVVIDDA